MTTTRHSYPFGRKKGSFINCFSYAGRKVVRKEFVNNGLTNRNTKCYGKSKGKVIPVLN